MIWGVSTQEWWFTEMTALFLVVGIGLGVISGLGEKQFVDRFVSGAADLVGVALVIGVARSINLIMESGLISDTILHSATNMVQGMNSKAFILVMLLVFIVLGFFIPSSSGLAVLSMPIMAPLADAVGLPRDVIVSAYQFGQGLISFITPTGLILATLAMVDVTYDKWLKFIMPLMGYIAVFAAVMLLIQTSTLINKNQVMHTLNAGLTKGCAFFMWNVYPLTKMDIILYMTIKWNSCIINYMGE